MQNWSFETWNKKILLQPRTTHSYKTMTIKYSLFLCLHYKVILKNCFSIQQKLELIKINKEKCCSFIVYFSKSEFIIPLLESCLLSKESPRTKYLRLHEGCWGEANQQRVKTNWPTSTHTPFTITHTCPYTPALITCTPNLWTHIHMQPHSYTVITLL